LGYKVFNGHTRGMVVPVIKSENEELVYQTDLVPMKVFLDKDLFSGYDLNPELAQRDLFCFMIRSLTVFTTRKTQVIL
jgi:hypothetical protein